MAKRKSKVTVQNRSLYSRISFLHQAATYYASLEPHVPPVIAESATPPIDSEKPQQRQTFGNQGEGPLMGMARRLATDLRSVSLKTRIRMSPAMKRFLCKYCDAPLVEGQSCSSFIENRSRGGKKPWADVLVRRCHTCGREKRYPVNAPRPLKKSLRKLTDGDSTDGTLTSGTLTDENSVDENPTNGNLIRGTRRAGI